MDAGYLRNVSRSHRFVLVIVMTTSIRSNACFLNCKDRKRQNEIVSIKTCPLKEQ